MCKMRSVGVRGRGSRIKGFFVRERVWGKVIKPVGSKLKGKVKRVMGGGTNG